MTETKALDLLMEYLDQKDSILGTRYEDFITWLDIQHITKDDFENALKRIKERIK